MRPGLILVAYGSEIKRWEQAPLAVSRIMQVWRDMVVRNKLLRDEGSASYLQRGHFRQAQVGFACNRHGAAESRELPPSIVNSMKESRSHA